jgi:acetyl esterase/lipase
MTRMDTSPTVELDPQLRDALATALELSAALGPPPPGIEGVREHAALCRRYWNEGGPRVACGERTVPGPNRDIPVVVYRPQACDEPLPVFVYLHGGGFKIGNHWANDRQMREMAQAWGGIVISADYLHVPEHVFPSAVEETSALLSWLHMHGRTWGIDGERIAVGGTSAGAVVAFGAAVALGGPTWLRAAVAIVGAFAADTESESMQRYGDVGLYPPAAAVPPMFADYLPEAAHRDDPRANLLRADGALVPPAFLAAAQYDVFRDASAALAERLRAAGRLHACKVYPGMSHLFFGLSRSVDRASECVRDIAAFLGERLRCPSLDSQRHDLEKQTWRQA